MALHVTAKPLIDAATPNTGGVRDLMARVESLRTPGSREISQAFYRIQNSIDSLTVALKQSTEVTDIQVTDDETGELIAWFGSKVVNGVRYTNFLKEVWIGGPSDPTEALIYTDDEGHVFIGRNGSVSVLDPFGDFAAWLGTQYDTLPVTGATDSGSGLIRLEVIGHTLATGDVVPVMDVGGVPNSTGTWTVTKIDADHIDLQGSAFDGTYTSGGTVNRLLHINSAADNGSGLIRLTTAVNHTYESGDRVDVNNVGGVPNATGRWIISVFDANHFDLVGSTWAGGYTSGGTAQRFFAGGNFQTISVGPSFVDYRLRAFADGSLKIRNATITVISNDLETTLNNRPGDVTTGTIALDAHDLITDKHNLVTGEGFFLQDPGGTYVGAFYQPGILGHGVLDITHSVHSGLIEISWSGAIPYIQVQSVLSQTTTITDTYVDALEYRVNGSVTITSTYIDTPEYRVGGVPGINKTIKGLNATTPITVTTGSAITSVDFAGSSTTSDNFVKSVVLNTATTNSFSKGILTS